MSFLQAVTLVGDLVTLEPLSQEHHEGLVDAARDGELWDVLRSHIVMSDGSLRDTVVYSIIQSEWPGVRNELRRRLAFHR